MVARGGTPALHVPATFVSRTEVECVTPPHAAGPVTVQVTRNGVDYEPSGVVFTCYPLIVVSALVVRRLSSCRSK